MSQIRKILKTLMEKKGHTGHALEALSGVPSATIYRFLRGKHHNPNPDTVRKWAGAYGITESQMRGDVPINWLGPLCPDSTPSRNPVEFLTLEERKTLKIMRKIRAESRKTWIKMGIELSLIPEGATSTADFNPPKKQTQPKGERRRAERRTNNNPLTGAKHKQEPRSGKAIKTGSS